MYNIAVCDDEKDFVAEMKVLLQNYTKETGIEFRISVFEDGKYLIENYDKSIDLIFLDIQMKDMDGLKTAEYIRKIDETVGIFFLTSLVQYALEGYQYQAVNYLVKPIKYNRLKTELNRWLEKYHKKIPSIVVSNDKGSFKIALNTLHYAETSKRNLLLHTDTEEILCYRKMKDLEQELLPFGFFRCHTGYLVNLAFVKSVEKLEIELNSGEKMYVSKPKKKEFMEALAGYWGKML